MVSASEEEDSQTSPVIGGVVQRVVSGYDGILVFLLLVF